jgi:alanine dehydrogenase
LEVTKKIIIFATRINNLPKTLTIMKIGIPKEIKNNENRVGMTPSGVAELVNRGHQVLVQHTAGEGSGFADAEYQKVGAQIVPTIEDVYAQADMIVKVKEPIEPEYALVRKGQVLFTYFHFACEEELTHAMMKSGAICIAYETVEQDNRSLPLLIPMSEVAGRMAVQNGAYYLQKTKGGKGKLMAGVPGVKPARVLVLGGGTVGEAAARIAAGMGAEVTITDVSLPRLKQLAAELPANVHTLYSSEHNIRQELPTVDVVIGSVLIPGDAAPKLITKDMLKLMERGTVLVDVAIDQGGCFETSHPTTHSEPVYEVDGIVHYAVANIPGAVPNTSTIALTNATLRYAIALADKGWKQACRDDRSLARGVNMVEGKCTYEAVAKVWGLDYTALAL